MSDTQIERYDVALVGGGIMSATMGSLIAQLMPDRSIVAFERLDKIAKESTRAMNNAGTGHAGNCELNYTPQGPDGVDISKALRINGAYELSLQFWSSLVERGLLPEPGEFINSVPHVAMVFGEHNRDFLRTRQELMSAHPMFGDMVYSTDEEQIAQWAPLTMEGREGGQTIAATHVQRGTDVDFGRLSKLLFTGAEKAGMVTVQRQHEVRGLTRVDDGWRLKVKNLDLGETQFVDARFVFLGAGGASLPLLQKSGVPEGRGYGGFPVSGQFLVCQNPDVVKLHRAKVYGKAALGAPPMSVPHLDTRFWNGKPSLLFGPFAGFTTKYLKSGSFMDLFKAVKGHNIGTMMAVGRDNWGLTKYLLGQATQSQANRVDALRDYFPEAAAEDWELSTAGYRVQIMKPDADRGGRLQFGTEVVAAQDGSLAALLGASPGASTAVDIMLTVLGFCCAEQVGTQECKEKIQDLIPSFGADLTADRGLLTRVRDRSNQVLGIG